MGNVHLGSHHKNADLDRGTSETSEQRNVATIPSLGGEDGRGLTFRERLTNPRDGRDFALMYTRKQDLGEGMTGRVTKVVDHHLRERAMKHAYGQDGTERSQLRELRREMVFLRSLDHPNLVRIIDYFEDGQKSVQMVIEMCRGGSLISPAGKSRISKSEKNTAYVIYQVLLAVNFLHLRGIAHRDIKEENIMFISSDPLSLHIVVIDFGLSSFVGLGDGHGGGDIRKLHTFCGTLPYMSPEVMSTSYDVQTDIWSIGVLAYDLITGDLPFHGTTDRILIKKIKQAKIEYTSPKWNSWSPDAKALVQHLLVVDASRRWTASSALKSPWFQLCLTEAEEISPDLETRIIKSIRNFMSYGPLRKLMSMVAAHYQFPPLQSSAREELSKVFTTLDLDKDGALSKDEFCYLLEKHGQTGEESHVFALADYEGLGTITYTAFVALCLEAFTTIDAPSLAITYDYLSHGRHHIQIDFVVGLSPLGVRPEIERILREADVDKDGFLERKEFLDLIDPAVGIT